MSVLLCPIQTDNRIQSEQFRRTLDYKTLRKILRSVSLIRK